MFPISPKTANLLIEAGFVGAGGFIASVGIFSYLFAGGGLGSLIPACFVGGGIASLAILHRYFLDKDEPAKVQVYIPNHTLSSAPEDLDKEDEENGTSTKDQPEHPNGKWENDSRLLAASQAKLPRDDHSLFQTAQEERPEQKSSSAKKSIFARGAQASVPIKAGDTEAHAAAGEGDLKRLKALIPILGADLRNNYGQTPLHTAIISGQLEIVKYLHEECGQSLQNIDNQGNNVFHVLFDRDIPVEKIENYKELIKYFISKGVSYVEPNNRRQTAIGIMAQRGTAEHIELRKALLNRDT